MGIRNTQYIVQRHHNTDHEHFHIVYNRIDNDLKLIWSIIKLQVEYKKLKDKYKLTYGEKENKVNRRNSKAYHGTDNGSASLRSHIPHQWPTRVDLTTLVDVLSKTFNVQINNLEQYRNTLTNSNLSPIYFLNILRNNLIEYSRLQACRPAGLNVNHREHEDSTREVQMPLNFQASSPARTRYAQRKSEMPNRYFRVTRMITLLLLFLKRGNADDV